MPVHSITNVNGFPVIDTGSKTIDTATIKITGPGGQVGKNDRIKAALQILLDKSIPLADLPAEDSHKNTDPATNREFWDGLGNIITRTIDVTSVEFIDGTYVLSLSGVR